MYGQGSDWALALRFVWYEGGTGGTGLGERFRDPGLKTPGLHHCPGEEAPAPAHREVVTHRPGPGALSVNHDPVWIPTKGVDVLLDPLQRCSLILPQPVPSRSVCFGAY